MKKLATLSILFLAFVSLISCKKTAIEGRVLDGFGNPVKDAIVKVEGTQFTSQTNNNGEYSIGYVPGDIKVIITKDGFTQIDYTLKISTESQFPAEDKTIYEIPKESGIWLMDFVKKAYVPIKKVMVNKDKTSQSGFLTITEYESYAIQILVDNYTDISMNNNDSHFVFFNNDPQNPKLIKLEDLPEGFCEILYRTRRNGAMGFAMGDFTDKINLVNEEFTDLGGGMSLRKVNLDAGSKYAFVNYVKKQSNPIQDLVYFFITQKK
jgi:hypothetical protein